MKSKRPLYLDHLSKDKRLEALLDRHPTLKPGSGENIWLNLTKAIVSQQLSTRVAEVIWKRFLALFGGEPTPEKVLQTEVAVLKSSGLSNAKASYILNIARFSIEKGMGFELLQPMADAEVIAYLTQIKGVGIWTAEMLLMFSLGREDVFSAGDLGIQQAMIRLYKLSPGDKRKLKDRMLKISEKWSPYRTYACLHLWHHKDWPVATTAKGSASTIAKGSASTNAKGSASTIAKGSGTGKAKKK
jgi:DNA-3-methyladenine glycosylase II